MPDWAEPSLTCNFPNGAVGPIPTLPLGKTLNAAAVLLYTVNLLLVAV